MRKYEIALLLAQRFNYTSYLEICTPVTGGTYAQVDKTQFERRVRLMYRCPSDFQDGEPIDYRTEGESAEELYAKLIQSGERFDLVFVDPWHTYTCSLRDLVFALQLVKEGGVVLVHDCNPPREELATPEFQSGDWCGVTYVAYLDIVLFTAGLHYLTVDSDYGCGIISRDRRLIDRFGLCPESSLAQHWLKFDLTFKYLFLETFRTRLLQMVSVEEFCRVPD